MRIWDINPSVLCKDHLLGEHRELHAIWNILARGKKSRYIHHPETKRWVGKLKALYLRHENQVKEMKNRGWKGHKTELSNNEAIGSGMQDVKVNTIQEQIENLRGKKCRCSLEEA